jgi:uncharacterized protein YwqG
MPSPSTRLPKSNQQRETHLSEGKRESPDSIRPELALGHAKPIQTDGVEFDCQLVADGIYHGGEREAELCRKALESACEWKLLLQVASDDNAGMVWGDLGRLYYCIKRDSLRRGSFDDVWLVLQTT